MDNIEVLDRPFFKVLARNDTGAAAGHQGGIVIPHALDRFFPSLSRHTNPANPTVDQLIEAALFIGSMSVGLVSTRYQYQTWGGTRSPERRITGNLGAIRNEAQGGDLLLMERGLANPLFYRLTLVRKGTPQHDQIVRASRGARWGPVFAQDPPVPETEVESEIDALAIRELGPFELFENAAALTETRVKRIARARAFQLRVVSLYDARCALCGRSHVRGDGASEAEAAHIVPRSLKGADDPRNGIALCRSHHWAFDEGLFGVGEAGKVVVPSSVAAIPGNAALGAFQGQRLRNPTDPALMPSPDAFAWHLRHRLQSQGSVPRISR